MVTAVSKDFDPEDFFLFPGLKGKMILKTFLAGTGSIGLNDGIYCLNWWTFVQLIDINSLRVDLKVKTDFGFFIKKKDKKVAIYDAANPVKPI